MTLTGPAKDEVDELDVLYEFDELDQLGQLLEEVEEPLNIFIGSPSIFANSLARSVIRSLVPVPSLYSSFSLFVV